VAASTGEGRPAASTGGSLRRLARWAASRTRRGRIGGSDRADLCIVSGCDHLRFNSFVNHRLFAEVNEVDYIFDLTLTPKGEGGYFNKLRAVRDRLRRYEAVFWIDDDAYFTDFAWRLRPYFAAHPAPMVICKSPINEGAWTWISSGQFLLRRCDRAFEILDRALAVDPAQVRAWWDETAFGLYTNGDQDALVHVLATERNLRNACKRLEYTAFNARPFHYASELSEHRLVHFSSGSVDKRLGMTAFAARLNVNSFLVPDDLLSTVRVERYAAL
jgi:hypothetical protein